MCGRTSSVARWKAAGNASELVRNMGLDLKIPDGVTTYLKERAANEYQMAVERYAADLLKEAGRLEAVAKSTGGDPEITSSMVKDADTLLRRGYARPSKKPLLIAAQLISTVGGFVTGLLADMDKLKDPGILILFIGLLVVTITAAVVAVVKD
jgi:hypothetical protein